MASAKRIGFYFSEKKIYCVESSDNNLLKVVTADYFHGDEASSTDDIRLIALIQKTLKENNVSQGDVRFSIPHSEVIIRSFLIPPMKASELSPVVDYELKKHIPFDLKEFEYRFTTINVTDNKVKKLRVLVAAVRQAVLQRYEQILNQAKLTLLVSEPAPFGLVRVLYAKKIVSPSARFALIHVSMSAGRILFVHEGVVLFIREFHLQQGGLPDEAPQDESVLKARLLNEVQNSLDFFMRSHEQTAVSQLIVLKSQEQEPYDQWLAEDINIPKKVVNLQTLIGNQKPEDQIGVLYAFGASLADLKTSETFNLSRKAVKKSQTVSMLPDVDINEYPLAIKSAIAAVVCLGLMYFLFNLNITSLQKSKDELSTQQGAMVDLSTEDIQKKIDKNSAKLKRYQAIVVKNVVTDVFINLSKTMPDGVWLNNLSIKQIVPTPKEGKEDAASNSWDIHFNATVFNKDPAVELRIVNTFIGKLKKDSALATYVKNIKLVNSYQQEINGQKVFLITVNCS